MIKIIKNELGSSGMNLDEVERLTSWCQDNCLSLNMSKTKELIVDFRKRQQRPYTPLMISGTPVERVSSRAVRLIEIEIKSSFELARFLNRFIAFFPAPPAPTSGSTLSEPIRMQQNRTDRAYKTDSIEVLQILF